MPPDLKRLDICFLLLLLLCTLVANSVAMKLPAIWPYAAEVWFAQADAQFAIRIVSILKNKFYHVVAVLPQVVAAQILDLIRAPPAGYAYKVLKECLITLYSLNNYQRFDALVSLPLSRDQKPLHLMNWMLAMLLKQSFLSCEPAGRSP